MKEVDEGHVYEKISDLRGRQQSLYDGIAALQIRLEDLQDDRRPAHRPDCGLSVARDDHRRISRALDRIQTSTDLNLKLKKQIASCQKEILKYQEFVLEGAKYEKCRHEWWSRLEEYYIKHG